MGLILPSDETNPGADRTAVPLLGVELRRESLYVHALRLEENLHRGTEGARAEPGHLFAYGMNGHHASMVEISYALLTRLLRWANSPAGQQVLREHGLDVESWRGNREE